MEQKSSSVFKKDPSRSLCSHPCPNLSYPFDLSYLSSIQISPVGFGTSDVWRQREVPVSQGYSFRKSEYVGLYQCRFYIPPILGRAVRTRQWFCFQALGMLITEQDANEALLN